MTGTDRVWLTPGAHERLQAELASLLRTRPSAGAPAESAHARAARIRQLRELLAGAVVGQDPPDDGIAEPGMVLTVRYDDTGDEETFLLGLRAAEHVDSGHLEVYSPTSPLGTALSGARPGDRCAYRVPDGSTVHVTLLRAVPYGHHPAPTG
jgi:transcription elongation factor GreA